MRCNLTAAICTVAWRQGLHKQLACRMSEVILHQNVLQQQVELGGKSGKLHAVVLNPSLLSPRRPAGRWRGLESLWQVANIVLSLGTYIHMKCMFVHSLVVSFFIENGFREMCCSSGRDTLLRGPDYYSIPMPNMLVCNADHLFDNVVVDFLCRNRVDRMTIAPSV